jgi:hypothetical protein
MPQGQTGSLNIHFLLRAFNNIEPQELYLRYYIKLGPNWTPDQVGGGTGGKFPGLADPRGSADPSGQCGNGGNQGDGINCWSARADYRNCFNACGTKPGATTRYGSYIYIYQQPTSTGSHGFWDGDSWGQTGGNCGATDDFFCGTGDGGVFLNDQWYLVEWFVKMNDVGQANGIMRGWVNGVLSYEKTNMIYRIAGHDNLYVRTVWLNVFKGGSQGNQVSSEIYLDQLVVARGAMIGPVATAVRPEPPTNLRITN